MVNRVVVFDLDDTLYPEQTYVKSGFRAVAEECERLQTGCSEAVFAELWSGYVSGSRGNAFDTLLMHHPTLAAVLSVDDLVAQYRGHTPKLSFFPGVEPLLTALKAAGVPLGLITDGHVTGQRHKIAALGLDAWMDLVVVNDQWGREYWKPHTRGFRVIQDAFSETPSEFVYVADNLGKDFVGPHALGWWTILLRLPDQVHARKELLGDPPHVQVDSIEKLDLVLKQWLRGQS